MIRPTTDQDIQASRTHYELAMCALRWAKVPEQGRSKAEHLQTIWANFCHDLPYLGIHSLNDLCWYDSHGRSRAKLAR